VDGLERELTGRVQILRLNVADEAGQRAQEHFGTTKLPVVVLLDGHGTELYRTQGKLPRRQQMLAVLDTTNRPR